MKSKAVALTAACLLAAASALAQEAELRPNWYEGQTARYELWSLTEQEQISEFAGDRMEQSAEIHTTAEATWRVESVRADGSARASFTFDWLRLEMRNGNGQEQVNDSRRGSGDNEMLHEYLTAMANEPLSVDIAMDGSVRSVEGLGAIRRQLEFEQLAPTEASMSHMIASVVTLPGAPPQAGPGASWTHASQEQHEVGQLFYETSFTLDEIGQIEGVPIATLLIDSQVDLQIQQPDIPADGPRIDTRVLEASRQGEVLFDLDRREAVGRNIVQNLGVEVTVNMEGQTMRNEIRERSQSQALRISEE